MRRRWKIRKEGPLAVYIVTKYNVQITHASFRELNLTLGTSVYLTFKSSAVSIF